MKKITTLVILLVSGVFVFAQTPIANAGSDTLFCGSEGALNATPSYGTGVWTCASPQVSIIEMTNPQSEINSTVLNTGNPTNPYFELVWTETNSEGTDRDTMKVIFARIPSSEMYIVPPKCFGELATFCAVEDSLHQYTWNFYNGVIDDTVPANQAGGYGLHYAYWNGNDTLHHVSLITMNSYNCQSVINIDTVFEPIIPEFEFTSLSDTCLLGKGAIIFADTLDTNAFFWLDENTGPSPNTPITTVYNLIEETYDIQISYITANEVHYVYYLTTFGNAFCLDTIQVNVSNYGSINADISVSMDVNLSNLTTDSYINFRNSSESEFDDINCLWDFNDGNILQNCDPIVEHIYTEVDCFTPFLILYSEDLPECRDTAYISPCINIASGSDIDLESKTSTVSIAPNPAKENFIVHTESIEPLNIKIYDSIGNIVLKISNYKEELISTAELAPGVYIVKCQNKNQNFSKKLIVK